MPIIRPQDALSTANPDQIKPAQPFMVGSYMDAETYFKSPYYSDSYYFPFNPDPLCRGNNYKVYDEMRDDDQVKVAISFKKDIVVNAGWQITCADPRVMEFVTTALKRMQEDGSLQMSFEDVLRDMLGSYEYGFSLSEPIFKIKDGMYVYDSIRVRPPQSFRFKVDDFGTTVEIIQMSNRGELYFDPKLFMHHIYQVEYGNPYGKSDLRAAHKAWVAKKHITKFLAIYLERFASPLVVGRYQPNDDTDELDKLNTALKSIQQTTTLIIPESAQIEFVQANKDSSETYIKALNYYNMHIARALLVPDLLGISGEKTHGGSYALGQDQFKMFLATIEKDRQSLARKITLRLVNPLVTANFGPGLKCDFEFVPYSMDDHTELMKIWSSLATGQVFKPSEDEINHLRKQLKFPEGPVDVVTQPPVPQAPQSSGQGTMKFGQRPIVRRTHFQGLPVNVEIEPGQQKCGIGPDGTAWSHTYKYPYGEIAGTRGHDGDPVDVYLGPDEDAGQVHVVHQNDHLGQYDEDKVFLGFPSPHDAERAYREHGPEFGFGKMDSMSLDEFRNGYMASGRSNFAARRALTSYEKKVDFAQIQKSMDDAESSLSKRLKSTARQIWGSYLAQVKDSGLIRNFNPQRLTELKPKFLKDMNLELKHGFRELLGKAYDEARHELFPDSPRKYGLDEGELEYGDMMDVLDAEAFNITADYSGLASKKINSTIAQGLKQGLSESEIVARVRDEMPDATDNWVNTLVRTKTTEIYNRGRKSYFDNDELAQKVIGGYQYSAVLDARTTEICRSLDKRVYREDDPNINLLTPPLHWNCFVAETKVRGFQKKHWINIEDIQIGDLVLTQSRKFLPVEQVHKNEYKGELIVIEMENGKTLRATPNHPIYTKNRGWVNAGELTESDELDQCEDSRKELLRKRYELRIEKERANITKLYLEDKKSLRQIGKIYGKNGVGAWIKKLGIPLRHGPEAVKTQWIGNEDRKMRASENLTRVRANYPHWKLGKKDPEASERMKKLNPMNMPGVKELALAKKVGIFRGPSNPMYGKTPSHPRPIRYNGMILKSSYELALVKYMESNGIKFEYEPRRFNLGFCTYVPDFLVYDFHGHQKQFIETKGWIKQKDIDKVFALQNEVRKEGIHVSMYGRQQLQEIGAL